MGNALTITKNVTVGESYDVIVVGGGPSGSHIAMASYRVTGNCCAMGEAAGKAAAYAVQNNVSVRQVPNQIVVPKT